MSELLDWYIDYDKFSEEEENLLLSLREEEPNFTTDDEFKMLEDEFFNRMPFCNISSENRYLRFDVSGTAIIDKVFEKEVDDDTLVISTRFEHNAVWDALSRCKNVYKFESLKNYDLNEIAKLLNKYKKVFVYIIGTQLMTGEITPQNFFIKLKSLLINHNKPHKMLIDDVHGMFITPRDYTLFDYVLYTAHSLVCDYNMGCLISKENDIGIPAYNWGKDYLKRLDLVLSRKEKLYMFKNILYQYFSEILESDRYNLIPATTQHIFSIETTGVYFTKKMCKDLFDYRIKIDEENYYHSHIRIRFQEFIRQSPENIYKGINLLLDTLKNLEEYFDNENYLNMQYE